MTGDFKSVDIDQVKLISDEPSGYLQAQLADDLITVSPLLVVENLPCAKRPVDFVTFGWANR